MVLTTYKNDIKRNEFQLHINQLQIEIYSKCIAGTIQSDMACKHIL